jgi:4-hydroxy-tetrahydrodipicolinate reductase
MYSIIQWGTGNVGRQALRTILERPDFELAGLRVYNADKVGKDAGDLLELAPTGVVATDSTDEIVALDADCVCYTALGSTLGDHEAPLDDITRLLASGKNVVSSAVEFHAYLRPDFQLAGAGTNALERLDAACAEGKSTFFHIGINPGFTMDLWPITFSRLSRRIDRITVTEIVDMSGYTSEHMVKEILGFGKPADTRTRADQGNPEEAAFAVCLRMVGDAMGIEFEELRASRETAVTDRDLSIAAGTIEAGTVAASKRLFQGVLDGRVVLSLEFVWRVSDQVAPEWPGGASRWLLDIEGDPAIQSEVTLSTQSGTGRATSLAVATLLLNSVPTVCAAPPGRLDNLTMPLYAGGYFGQPDPRLRAASRS